MVLKAYSGSESYFFCKNFVIQSVNAIRPKIISTAWTVSMMPSFFDRSEFNNASHDAMLVIRYVCIRALRTELNMSLALTKVIIFLKHGQHLGRTFLEQSTTSPIRSERTNRAKSS